jgi:plastocyanin
MNKNTKILGAVGVVLVLVLVGAFALAKGKKADNNSTAKTSDSMNMTSNTPAASGSSSSSSSSATDKVNIQNFAFSPAAITVKVGTKITWTNNDAAPHTVTADSASSDAPASSNVANGGTYSFTFNKAGIYAYHCAIHPSMHGTVTVTN